MNGLRAIEWGDCLLEPKRDAEIERLARSRYGIPYPVVRLYTPCPWLARTLAVSNRRSGQLVHLDWDLADLIFLAVSQDNSCRYCYASQRAQMRILGFDEARIRSVEEASFAARAHPRDRLVVDFARRVSRVNPPPSAADVAALADAGMSDGEIREVVQVAATTVFGNRVTMIPALPVAEMESRDFRGWQRMLVPVLARLMRSRERRGEPTYLTPEQAGGPFGYVARAGDGLPLVVGFQQVVLDAWSSPVLSRRAKALVFAVVAHGLASRRSDAEARELLAAEGLGGEQVDEILAHLGSPVLDPVEALVVPFARETIRCRPEEIQPRARALRESLSVRQFLEVVGVVGLANAIVRLSLVFCES